MNASIAQPAAPPKPPTAPNADAQPPQQTAPQPDPVALSPATAATNGF